MSSDELTSNGIDVIESIFRRSVEAFQHRGLHALERAPINDGIQYIKGLQQESGGFSLMANEEATPLMTGYAMLAMGLVGIELGDPVPERAVKYLQAVQHASGGFGYYVDSGPSLGPTAIIAQALKVLGAKRSMAMLQGCQRFIASKYDNGRWRETLTVDGEEEGGMEIALTAMCVLALGNTLLQSEREAVVAELIRSRNHDGGWGWSIGCESDVDHTGMAILALMELVRDMDSPPQDVRSAIEQGREFLLSCQRPDGGFSQRGSDDVTAIDTTGLAVIALAKSRSATEEPVRRAAGFFLRTQNADGGWGDRPGSMSDLDSTFFVLQALMAAGETIITLHEVEHGLADLKQEIMDLFRERVVRITDERDDIAADLKDAERKVQMLEAALGVVVTIATIVMAIFGIG